MRDTRLVSQSTPDVRRLLVPGYTADNGHAPIPVHGWIDPATVAAAGAIRSTARDMAQWVRLQNGRGAAGGRRLVREATFAELITPHAQNAGHDDIGLDLVLARWRGRRLAWHSGALMGAHALLAFLPDDGVGFAMLCNTLPVEDEDSLHDQLLDTVFGTLLPDAREAPAVPESASPAAAPPVPWQALPAGSPSIEALMARTIAAQGGESALRKARSRELIEDVAFDAHGVEARVRRLEAAPAMYFEERDVRIGGKRVGTNRHWFDGTNAYIDEGGPIDEPLRLPAIFTTSTRDANDFYGDVSWKTLWKEIRIAGTATVEGEPTFVVEKKAASGLAVTSFVSTRTFLPVRRAIGTRDSVTYGDWRMVGGVRIPFTRVIRNDNALGDGGNATVRVREVHFDVPAREEMFRPPAP